MFIMVKPVYLTIIISEFTIIISEFTNDEEGHRMFNKSTNDTKWEVQLIAQEK